MNYTTLNSNELLANIAGTPQAMALMDQYQSLTALARADENDLMQVPGVGAAKAAAIKSAFTLALKMSQESVAEPPLLDTPEKIANLMREEFRLRTVEALFAILLNTRKKLLKYVKIADGTLDTVLVHPREVFRAAIAANAAAIVLVHNHNMDPSPSEADIKTTRDLLRAGQLMKIELVVRGLDLVPIASEILALTPVEKDGVFTFTDANISLRVEGRKFRDAKNSKCTGSGAIDLVMKLGDRNFKQAVEYLLTKNTTDNLVADAVSVIHEQEHEKIAALNPKPRILTMEDIPAQIWQPVPTAWADVRRTLLDKKKLAPRLIDQLYDDKMIWAVSDETVAFARTGADTKTAVGVTLLNLKSENLEPRILAPDQQGFFWLGGVEKNANRIIAVANPMEALSYRELMAIQNPETEFRPGGIVATSHIVSVDGSMPPEYLIRKINPSTQKFFLATNAPEAKAKLAEKFPWLVIDEELPDWLKNDALHFNNPRKRRTDAWNALLAKIKAAQPQIEASQVQTKVLPLQKEAVKIRSR